MCIIKKGGTVDLQTKISSPKWSDRYLYNDSVYTIDLKERTKKIDPCKDKPPKAELMGASMVVIENHLMAFGGQTSNGPCNVMRTLDLSINKK